MDIQELRLEALRIASRDVNLPPERILAIATKYVDFVQRGGMTREVPPHSHVRLDLPERAKPTSI